MAYSWAQLWGLELKNVMVLQFGWPVDIAAHFEFIVVGALIILS